MDDAVSHMRLSQCTDLEVLDIPFSPPAVIDAYDTDLDEEGDWDLSNIPSFGETDIRLRLRMDFTGVSFKCVQHSVEALESAAGIFNFLLSVLNTLEEHRELLTSVERLHSPTLCPSPRTSHCGVKYRRDLLTYRLSDPKLAGSKRPSRQ